jgi:hypothetical protein
MQQTFRLEILEAGPAMVQALLSRGIIPNAAPARRG